MRLLLLLVSLAALRAPVHGTGRPLADILSRVSEESEVFRQQAPQLVSEETYSQRLLRIPRLRPRLGAAAVKPVEPTWHTRQMISEYSIAHLQSAPDLLHEFRQIVSLDGRSVTTGAKARHALALGMRSDDDGVRKKMLETFQRYGFDQTAVDLGLLLLLFTKRHLADFHFEPAGFDRAGADEVQVISYKQVGGEATTLVFSGRQAIREPLQGKIFVRAADGLPVRITMQASRQESRHVFREDATVDYVVDSHGVVVPASAVHRGYADGALMVENTYQYSPFKKFGAEAEIKFTEIPDPPR